MLWDVFSLIEFFNHFEKKVVFLTQKLKIF